MIVIQVTSITILLDAPLFGGQFLVTILCAKVASEDLQSWKTVNNRFYVLKYNTDLKQKYWEGGGNIVDMTCELVQVPPPAKVFQASNNQQLFAISDKSTTKLKKSICFNHSAFHSMKVLSWSNKQTDWYAVQWHCASPFHLTDKALYLFGFVRYFILLVQTHWILSGGIRLSCLHPPPGKLLYKCHLCRWLTSLWL